MSVERTNVRSQTQGAQRSWMKRSNCWLNSESNSEPTVVYNKIAKLEHLSPVPSVGPVIKDSKRLPEGLQARNNVFPCSRPNALFVVPRFQDVRHGVGVLVMPVAFLHHSQASLGLAKRIDEGRGGGPSVSVPATAEPMHHVIVFSRTSKSLT